MTKKRLSLERLGAKLFQKSGEGNQENQENQASQESEENQGRYSDSTDYGESKQTQNREAFLKGLFDIPQLTSMLPYATFDEETDLFYNTDSLGFVIETEPLTGASLDIQTQIQNFFNTVMPAESALQVILYADPYIGDFLDRYQKTRGQGSGEEKGQEREQRSIKTSFPILQEMVAKRSEFFKSLAYGSDYSPFTVRNFRVFWAFTIGTQGTRASEVITVREQLMSTLSMIGLNPFLWKPEDLLTTVDSILHCAQGQTHHREFTWNPYQNLSDQLALLSHRTDIEEEAIVSTSAQERWETAANQTKIFEEKPNSSDENQAMKIRTFSVCGQPDEWSLSLMADLVGHELNDRQQIGCPFLLHYGIFIPKQDGLKAKIFSKESIVSKQAHSALSKILPHLKRESAELSYVLSRLNTGDRIVQTNMSLILLSPEEMVDSISNAVKNIFITHQWRLLENKRFHLPSLLMSLPMNWSPPMVEALGFHKLLKTTLTTEVANNLPCQGEWRGSRQPCFLMAGRKGQVFTWSPFENDTNYNTIVVGTSGSGKSVAMQELMMSLLGMGARVIVFDLGRSFEKSCYLVEGQHIRFEKSSQMCINPFSFVEEGNEESDINERRDQLEGIALTMEQMAARREGILDIQGNFLQKAVMDTFLKYGRKSTVTKVVEALFEHEDSRAKDVGTLLFNYTKEGSYGKWFEGEANVDLKSDLVVIELEDLKEKPSLQNVVLQSFLASMTQQLYLSNRKRKTVFIVDEAAQLLENKFFSKSAQDMARRVRKYEASLVVGTQSFADFYANDYAINILENAAWVLMLNQVPEAIQQLSESKKMAVTAHIEAKMKSVKTVAGKYAEILIKSYKGYTVGRLLLDPFSLMLYSTKADEFAAVNDLREQGFSVQEAVQRLVDLKKQGLEMTQLSPPINSTSINPVSINPGLVPSTPIRKVS